MIHTVDYLEAVKLSGLQGQIGRKVEEAIRKGCKDISNQYGVSVQLINQPGSFMETDKGTFQVIKNGRLRPVSRTKSGYTTREIRDQDEISR